MWGGGVPSLEFSLRPCYNVPIGSAKPKYNERRNKINMEKKQIDTDRLRKSVRNFQFYSTPSNGTQSAPCTVGDIHKLIDNIAKVLNVFVDELEESDE